MSYRIINWKRHQSRPDRDTSYWVKLHKKLLLCDDFFDLDENIRWQWPCLLLLAQHSTGVINKSNKQIARALNISRFNPNPFLGTFLEVVENGSRTVSEKNQMNTRSISTSSSNNKRNSRRFEYPEDFLDLWEISPKTGSKKRAHERWEKCSPEKRVFMYAAMLEQTKWRAAWAKADPKHFIPYWKDMERWIKDDRHTDELIWPKPPPEESHRRGEEERPGAGGSDEEWAAWFDMSVEEYREAKARRGDT